MEENDGQGAHCRFAQGNKGVATQKPHVWKITRGPHECGNRGKLDWKVFSMDSIAGMPRSHTVKADPVGTVIQFRTPIPLNTAGGGLRSLGSSAWGTR